MTCQEFWELIPELGHTPSAAHMAHMQACDGCARRLEAQRGLLRGLRGLAAESARLHAPSRVEARLLTAFRGHTGAAEPPRRGWIPVLTWAMAAAVLAAIGLFLLWGRPPAEPAERTSPSRRRVELAAAPATVERNVVHLASFDGEFLPLPNAAEITPDEEVNLVRLQLSRSALLALGVPMESSRVADSVQADFVLGIDGRARAVRLVEE